MASLIEKVTFGMNYRLKILVLVLIVTNGCKDATVDTSVARQVSSQKVTQQEKKIAVAAHSGAFDARLEADVLASFWGPGAEIRRMYGDEAVAFEVNVAAGNRSLTSRFVEQSPVEVNFFTGTAKAEDIERMRDYLKRRYPNAEWKPALGHLVGGGEEQWRILPLAEPASAKP